jgi:hypothetical protein
MNERILKLAVKAGMYVDLNGTPWPRAMSAEESESAYKKFAQLVVRECALQCQHNDDMDRIEKHFGVEP